VTRLVGSKNKELRSIRDKTVRELYEYGYSLDNISDKISVSREMVRSIVKRLKLPPRDRKNVGVYRK
jgi:hypothetical protein